MVPLAALRIAGHTRVDPLALGIVPNIPLVPVRNPALMAEDEAHIMEELIDIELQRFRQFQLVAIEINIVGEAGQR